MTEAFSNNLGSHLGRHLLYWAIKHSDIWYLGSRCADLLNKFTVSYETCLLTLDDEEFAELTDNNNYPLNYNHNVENFQILNDLDENNNELSVNDLNNNNIYIYGLSNNNNFDLNEMINMNVQNHRIMTINMNEQNNRRNVETLNNSNGGLLLSPPHNSALHQRDSSNNMQITQPNSAPSSPLASPGAISISPASFCMPSSGSSSTVDTADPNWQATKATVLERNAAMFNNELMSDIKFLVGSDDNIQSIPAHKYILATGSSVFYAMFYGGLAENKSEIKVPDVEPSAFLTLLKYLYCDEIQLEPDNILATLYAAKKYIVPHLARACVNYLEVSLTAKNACLLLSQSRLFEEPELMQRCWEVIDAQAEMAIKSEGFVDIDLKTFESILSRETLNCKEIHLFEAALNWAHNACQKMEIDPTAQNKRSVLGAALHLIRIPTMTLEEFANGVAQTGILTSQETIDIFLNFTAKSKPQLNFATKARTGLKTQVCHRFQSCAYRSNQWRYRGRCDSIQFSVDRRIFIVGFGLYGSSTGAADYNVKIELKRLGRVLAENDTKFFSDGSSNTFHVFFENPIQIEPDCYYTASVILDGNELSFFGQEGMSEVCMGKVNFQFQCSSESTNGTGVQGGQIPELIFYGPTNISNDCNSPTNSHCTSPLMVGTASGAGVSSVSGAGTVAAGSNCDDVSNL